MKTKKLTMALLAGLSLPLLSQQGPPPPRDPVGVALDKDRDGELSRSEIRRAVRALLKLDEDDDGALSAEELRPEPPQKRGRGGQGGRGNQGPKGNNGNAGQQPPPPPSELMTALDTDKSGDLSKAEIEAAEESLGKLDLDDNGKLTPEECGMKNQQGGGNRPGGGPRGPGGPPPGGRPRGQR